MLFAAIMMISTVACACYCSVDDIKNHPIEYFCFDHLPNPYIYAINNNSDQPLREYRNLRVGVWESLNVARKELMKAPEEIDLEKSANVLYDLRCQLVKLEQANLALNPCLKPLSEAFVERSFEKVESAVRFTMPLLLLEDQVLELQLRKESSADEKAIIMKKLIAHRQKTREHCDGIKISLDGWPSHLDQLLKFLKLFMGQKEEERMSLCKEMRKIGHPNRCSSDLIPRYYQLDAKEKLISKEQSLLNMELKMLGNLEGACQYLSGLMSFYESKLAPVPEVPVLASAPESKPALEVKPWMNHVVNLPLPVMGELKNALSKRNQNPKVSEDNASQ